MSAKDSECTDKCLLKTLRSLIVNETQRQPEEASVQMGSALGPDWHDGLKLKGLLQVKLNFEISNVKTIT